VRLAAKASESANGIALCCESRSNFAMKHAGPAALDRAESLLKDIRKREHLKEKTRGNFYRSSRAFLHFHEHGENELYADIRLSDDFERLPATTPTQRTKLLRLIDKALNDGNARRSR
jgi:hypothetical protein